MTIHNPLCGVKAMDLVYRNNVFNSSNDHFFLHESATKTSLHFEGNTVNALNRKGIFYANYSGQNYKFTNAKITNNIFNGVNRASLNTSLKSASKLTMSGNIYK